MGQGLVTAAAASPQSNRYSNLFPYDASRVVLRGGGGDYVNASWVEVEGVPGRLVLAMGPMHPSYHGEDTAGAFWRLVAQEQVEVVVMLCKEQAGYSGCARYWPEVGEVEERGGVRVEVVGEERRGGTVVRRLEHSGAIGGFNLPPPK